jgi:hypothetical protein
VGNGGAVLLQNPINLTTTGDISAGIELDGGDGGITLQNGTMGGDGASAISLANTFNISASSTSNVVLGQTAKGGTGGASGANATAPSGVAGNAVSNMTYSLDVATIELTATAVGGSDLQSGGTASAIADATNTKIDGSAQASAFATGGSGGSGHATAVAFASVTVDDVTLTQSVTTTDGTTAYANVYLAGSSSGPTITSGGTYGNITIGATCSANASLTQTGGTVIAENLSIGDTDLSCPYQAVYHMQGGTLTITNGTTINHTGTFNQTGGTASLGNVSGNGTITLSNGSLTVATLSMPSGHVSANGTLTFSPTSATRQTSAVAIEIGNLTVGTAGLIDLTNHDLIIHGGETLSQVEALIVDGIGGTTGITSSTVADTPGTALGYATAGELGISTFDGISVTSTDILVKYTYIGDANLDGEVNNSDFVILAHNFGASPADWSQADFNYDGVVGPTDFGIFATYDDSGTGGSFGNPLAVVATPEPGSLAMLGVTSALLVRRRKLRPV